MRTTIAPLTPRTQIRRSKLGAVLLLLSAGPAFTGCHKEEPAPPPPAVAKEEPAPAVEAPKPVAEAPKPEAAVAPKETAPSPELLQRVTAFKAFHPFSTASQLFKVPQFTAPLSSLLKDAAKNPKLVDRIMSSGKMATDSKPFAGTPKLDLRIDHSTPALTDGLLAAVLSGDPAQLVDFVLGGVENAKVEFVVLPAKTEGSAPPP